MPRLPPSLLRHAHRTSPHLAALLPVCRDLASARNELRWIREHVAELLTPSLSPSQPPLQSRSQLRLRDNSNNDSRLRTVGRNLLLGHLCRRRGQGVPLQYLLGTQPFGDLEIRCRAGVLIPRPETEAWVARLAEVVREDSARDGGKGLRVLDLCTGTGCIALLLHSLLRRRSAGLRVRGVDIEPRAVALARENLAYNTRLGFLPKTEQDVAFEKADIFSADWLSSLLSRDGDGLGKEKGMGIGVVDILVSNPPYISTRGFNCDTERSVRRYEPRLALVPAPSTGLPESPECQLEDIFYARILGVAKVLQPRLTVLEVGDLAQGLRVVQMARSLCGGVEIEIWRDWPDIKSSEDEPENVKVDGMEVPVRGSGHGRALFIRRVD
ncbi:S-adenosyl-L-methionine-dependent methyltransferase [Annulohypoxylon bovei var. microspora]|nr:S-adenosyl-L-methionine-dependent methyltransferase [Annulohypoxylon bovei var. microspora]